MTIFYFVRHAHADWTPDENRPLSARGAADAMRVAAILADCPIAAIYASPARRAAQTVEPLALRRGLPIATCEGLAERVLAGSPVDDFAAAVAASWRDPDGALPGGESNRAAQRRGLLAVRAIERRHPAGQVVVATHGNLLALILQAFDPAVDHAFWQALAMPDIYRVETGAAISRLWPGGGA